MNKLKCVVVDDEPLARDVLTKYIGVVDYLELASDCENVLELSQVIDNKDIDLVFLDIQMPHMTGIEFLNIQSNLPMVILTTAYSDYALESFQLDVVDYLLKPITFNRFFKAVAKAKVFSDLKGATDTAEVKTPSVSPYFFIKCENKYEKIITHKILFIKALQNYVFIQTEEESYMTLLPLKKVEEYLNRKDFMKVHKSFLVAISKIDTIENHEVKIRGHSIPVSRNFKDEVKNRVLKNKVLKKE